MSTAAEWAAWPLLAMFGAFMVRGFLWATEPKRTLLDEHYDEIERGEK